MPQRPQSDFNGEGAYIREKMEDGSYAVHSPYYVPVLKEPESWSCRVGLGYSLFESRYDRYPGVGLSSMCLNGKDYVVRHYEIINESDRPRNLDLVPVVEFSHFDALKQFTNADWVPQTMQASVIRRSDGSLAGVRQAAFMMKGKAENWFAASGIPVSSIETDREQFLGEYGFRGWADPAGLHQPELSGTEALRGNTIGALMLHLGELQARQGPGIFHLPRSVRERRCDSRPCRWFLSPPRVEPSASAGLPTSGMNHWIVFRRRLPRRR